MLLSNVCRHLYLLRNHWDGVEQRQTVDHEWQPQSRRQFKTSDRWPAASSSSFWFLVALDDDDGSQAIATATVSLESALLSLWPAAV